MLDGFKIKNLYEKCKPFIIKKKNYFSGSKNSKKGREYTNIYNKYKNKDNEIVIIE